MKAAFTYHWYPSHWAQAGSRTPVHGQYRSDDPGLARVQASQMRWAGIEVAICSWWGRGDESDLGLDTFLYGSRGIVKCAVHYEKDIDGKEAEYKADLAYLKQKPLLQWGGKPVLFAYRTWDDRVSALAKLWAPDWHVVTQRAGGDSQYIYDVPPSQYTVVNGKSFTVSPGFWQNGELKPRVPRDLVRFRELLKWAEATRGVGWPWQLLISWNEIIEGTEVEPMRGEDGAALQVVREVWG